MPYDLIKMYVCVCFTHFPDALQAESCLISVRLQRSLEHLQYIRKTDVSALCTEAL